MHINADDASYPETTVTVEYDAGDGDSCIQAKQFTDSIELVRRAQQESVIS